MSLASISISKVNHRVKSSPFLKGTILLTATGFVTRFLGFFYRIFLSHTIGEEGMGIVQLTAPLMALSYALTCGGIQTAISKHTAAYHGMKKEKSCLYTLLTGISISLLLSAITAYFLYTQSTFLSVRFLKEERCAPLVRLFSLSLPFSSLHSCINGYYYGKKKTLMPSLAQLLEQLVRVGSVFAIYKYLTNHGLAVTLSIAMIGTLLSECFSMFFCGISAFLHLRSLHKQELTLFPIPHFGLHSREIMGMAIPLIANRLVLTLLQSIEAVSIPDKLVVFGLSKKAALQQYGVLTGMALPLLLFPSAITGAVATLLMPYVSQAKASGQNRRMKNSIRQTLCYSICIGCLCLLFFLGTGRFLGEKLFHSKLAGAYIQMLSITCPFLYASGILNSILNGIGKTSRTFVYNSLSLILRLAFVLFLMPKLGMISYILGILCSQLLFTLLALRTIRRSL